MSVSAQASTDESASVLSLSEPLTMDLGFMYADGGTLGGTITDSNGKSLMFSYDGRQTFWAWLPWHKYHVYLGVHHPTHAGSVKLPIFSDEEIAIFKLVANWVEKEYPEDWQDSKKWASSGYVKRFLEDMKDRPCNRSN